MWRCSEAVYLQVEIGCKSTKRGITLKIAYLGKWLQINQGEIELEFNLETPIDRGGREVKV